MKECDKISQVFTSRCRDGELTSLESLVAVCISSAFVVSASPRRAVMVADASAVAGACGA